MRQEYAFERFKRIVASGRLAHAYIVEGAPRGAAGALVENVLGLLYCEAAEKPCGECRSCRRVREHSHPDILWVEPQKKSRRISIEQIRELEQSVFKTAFSGGWKACVLVGADRLGDQASNAFLKTLEEPAAGTVFFLVTNSPQALLPTIASRCQRVGLSGEEETLPKEHQDRLVDILSGDFSDEMDEQGAASLRATLAFARADDLNAFLKDLRKSIEEEETEAGAASGLEEDEETLDARVSSRYREARVAIMRFIQCWHRDLLLLAGGLDEAKVLNQSSLALLKRQAQGLDPRQALRAVRCVEEMNGLLERNLPEGAVYGFGFQTLLGAPAGR